MPTGAAAAGGGASSVTFLGYSKGDGSGSTAESVTIDLGTAHAGDKIVVVLLHANWAGANSTVATATIDGQTGVSALTQIQSASETGSMWYFDDTSGVVGGLSSIDFTFATAELISICAAYRLVGVVTGAPTTTATESTTGTTSTLSLNVAASAIVIGGSTGRSASDDTMTWTGLTEDNEDYETVGGYNVSTGSAKAVATETPRAVTGVWGASQTRVVGVAASWNQA